MSCKVCEKRSYSEYCTSHKPRKSIRKRGKQTLAYEAWRDKIAIPYLNNKFGKKCVECNATDNLDVDHIKSRGSHYDLRMSLENVQYLCRGCHRAKTDNVNSFKPHDCDKCDGRIFSSKDLPYHEFCSINYAE